MDTCKYVSTRCYQWTLKPTDASGIRIALVNVSVASASSYQLSLPTPSPSPQAYANCYLQIIGGASYIATTIFVIGASNGPPTHWPKSAPLASVPALAPPAQAPTSGRPAIHLPTDGSGNRYTTGKIDCWIDLDDHHPECWDVLNLDIWLAQWFLKTPQCSNNSHVNCNAPLASGQGPRQEAWTNTFVREAEGPGSDCTLISNPLCSYSSEPSLGANDSPLTRTRYRYVIYSIYGLCPFNQVFSVNRGELT